MSEKMKTFLEGVTVVVFGGVMLTIATWIGWACAELFDMTFGKLFDKTINYIESK